MKYLRNRLTIDDGSNVGGSGGDDEKKTFDIAKAVETEDERKKSCFAHLCN